MKTNSNFLRWAMATGVALNMTCMGLSAADAPNTTAMKERTLTGVATVVDPQEQTILVKDFWGTRTFHLAQDCTFSLQDKQVAMFTDLHPGQKVLVQYEKSQGVLIAHQINQENVYFKGYITAMDPGQRTLVVRHGPISRQFLIPQDCTVTLRDDKTGSLDDLKIGNTINVVYETPGKRLTVRSIEQPDPTFIGTVEAIDAETGVIKVKHAGSEKKFILGDECKIVVAGKTDGKLGELQIGDRAAVTYEDADGVLVANRIGREPGQSPAQNASRTDNASRLNGYPSWPTYPQ